MPSRLSSSRDGCSVWWRRMPSSWASTWAVSTRCSHLTISPATGPTTPVTWLLPEHPCYLLITPNQVLHLGYPGSAASLAQQQGRAGRGTRPALSLLVAHDGPLDQAVASDAARLLSIPPEGCVLPYSPITTVLLTSAHLLLAAFYLPAAHYLLLTTCFLST